MKLSKHIEAEAIQAYRSFWEANLSADMEIFASCLLDDFSIFGTANGEVFFGKQQAVRFYTDTADQMKGKIELRNRDISAQGIESNSVVVCEQSDVYVLIGTDWTFYGKARISCVLLQTGNGWKAVHQHASLPDHRTEEGQQIAAEKIAKENLELKEAVQRRTVELQAKNRELEIEAALERVRARTMAMRHSNELLDSATLLFEQLRALGVNAWNCSFNIWSHDKKHATAWNAVKGGFGRPFDTPSDQDVFLRFYEAAQRGEEFYVEAIGGDALVKHYEYMSTMPGVGQTIAELKAAGIALPTFQVFNIAQFAQGYLMFITYEEVPQFQNIFKRFTNVFEQTYTRFLDLQKAEAQTREAQIEFSLERVRARTMAMQHSNELADASFVLDTQVRSLGIKTWGCAFNIYGDNESTEWFSSAEGALPTYKTPRENIFLRYYDAGQRGEQLYIEEFVGETCAAHYEYLCTVPVMGDALRGMKAAGFRFPERQIDHVTFFKYGYLLFITLEPVPDAHEIFIRFAKVFEQTYTRFLDLKKTEDNLVQIQATQKQLIHAEKMASLGELTAGIAHEIQNPLNFVNNFSEINKELIEEVKSQRSILKAEELDELLDDIAANEEKINHHGKRADSIVKGMLQHSRTNNAQKEFTDINALCDEYLRLSYHGLRAKDKNFNATFLTDLDGNIGKINIIPQDIGRVLLNLFNNAFYAVNEKKKQGETGYEPKVTVSTKKNNGFIEITVCDNGPGIPDAIKEKIFQPFFTTKPTGQGTGLGLSLSHEIVSAHNGTIALESTAAGTRFTIQLNMQAS